MKILVVGSGGREHALVWKLAQSPEVDRIFCAPGNAGTEGVGENVPIPAKDLPKLARFAKENRIDLTVIGPDDALAAGIVDLFETEGLRVFGPNKKAARLEASKIFAKELMSVEKIPTAQARTFSSSVEALNYCDEVALPVVIKADGLALGKGVVVAHDRAEARQAVRSMMEDGAFGEAGRSIIMEECLRGSECSVHALVSGKSFRMLATARDHKRALDGDEGPNTGGMGAVSPADNWDAEREREFAGSIMQPLLDGLTRNGAIFRGLLFPGLMITDDGLRVLEFNCRFGDPETQAILPRMKSNLLPLLLATIEGGLENVAIEFDPRIAVTVILASGGYPGKYETGKPIEGLETAARLPDVQIFHAGTMRQDGKTVTSGGRVLAITALGDSVPQARERAYAAISQIHFDSCHFRRDIACAPLTHRVSARRMKTKTIVAGALLVGIASAIFAQTPSSSAQPSASAATKTTVDSLAPAEIDETIRALKSNFVDPNALKDQEINRATLEGLLTRLHGGAMLMASKTATAESVAPFYSEVLGNHIGYLRIGSLTNDNLRAMEKALTDFTPKKVDALVIDLRATSSSDFDIAAETTKRFVAKDKTLWTVRKTAAHQDRAFTDDHDSAFQGTIMVLIDGETSGPAEAMAAALKTHGQGLLIGQPTAGRAVEYSDFPLSSGKILRIAVGEVIGPNGQSLFPGGLKPDLPVELSPTQKHQIFALSMQRGLATFVFERERPHFNEAALIAGTNPELDIRQQRRNSEENLHDSVLQRAVDVITSLAVFQKH